MGRIFTLYSIVAVLMVLLAGGSVYWLSMAEMQKTRQEATESVARGASLAITAQVELLEKAMDKIVLDPGIIAAVKDGDPAQLVKAAGQIENYLPDALTVRIFLPGTISPDESTVPHLGFADIELVQDTFKKNKKPVIQGKKGPNRHMAIARRIENEGKVIGVVLASLNYQFLGKSIRNSGVENDYLELKQDRLVMGSIGKPDLKEKGKKNQLKIPGTDWVLQFWTPGSVSLGNLSLFASAIIIPALIACLAFFIFYRRFSEVFRLDRSSILKLFKDLMMGQSQGNYPVILGEMQTIVATVLQFKRVLDEGDISSVSGADGQGMEMDSFFSELDSDEGLDIDDIFSETADGDGKADNLSTGIEISGEKDVEIPVAMPDFDQGKLDVATFGEQGLDSGQHQQQAIFRAYDIRGVVGVTLNRDVVYDIGQALGSETKEQGVKTVIVARDGRNSSPELSESLIQGILSTGRDVLDIGMVPTPVLYFVVQHSEGRTGVMVTGSHNPGQYNGLKMVINGETLAGDRIQGLRKRIIDANFATGEKGELQNNAMAVNEYIGTISEDVHIGRPMQVVVDCGNGVAGELAPTLLKTMGCEVIELFCDIDGNFPNHHPDPSQPENLADLISAVQHYEADLGIAFDGDGDRLGIVDSKGKIIWPDRQMMLFAKNVLAMSPGAEVIFDVKCTRHLPEQIKKYGGRPLMWKTGHSLMKAKLKETAAKLAGEMSGHIYFNDRWFGFDDGLYSACRMVEILSEDSRSSSEVFAELPDSVNTPEMNIDLKEGENFTFMEAFLEVADFPEGKITVIDGIRVDFADGWGLVRASNTTPSLVLRFEADNNESLIRIQKQFGHLMARIKPGITLPF